MEDGVDGLRGGDEEDSGGCCWRPVCADEGSSVASVLMRETVACGRLKREDLPRKGGSGVDGSRGRRKIVGRVGGAGLGSLKMGEDERKGRGAAPFVLSFWPGKRGLEEMARGSCDQPGEGKKIRAGGGGGPPWRR